MTDRIDVEELVERLKGLAAEGALIHTFSWGLVVSLLSDAATALSALEQYAALGRACESNGLGWYGDDGDMYFQAPADAIEEHATEWAKAALSALEKERDALKALVGRMVEGLEPFAAACEDADEEDIKDGASAWESPMAMSVTYGDFRRARSLLSEAKGEGER